MPLPVLTQPPIAETVSEQARAQIAMMMQMVAEPMPELSIEQMRTLASALTQPVVDSRIARYGVTIKARSMGSVPIHWIEPAGGGRPDRLLINLHGGGFVVDSGSLNETVPIAALTGITIAAVLYRLAPEHPFPAAVDDALAVYRDALEFRAASDIAIFGTSAGAVLSIQLLARLKAEGLPLPAAAGIFSGAGDLSRAGDIEGYLPPLPGGRTSIEVLAPYVGSAEPRDQLLSPQFGDLSGLPPILLMTSTRDQLLSHTAMLDLALRKAGVETDLMVYEGMPHAFWAGIECPETEDALQAQADFLQRKLA
jgi:acetyl esterase/lipase